MPDTSEPLSVQLFCSDAVENTVSVEKERSLRRSDWELGVPLLNQCFGSRELPDFHRAVGNPWSPSSRHESLLPSSSWSDVRAALQLRRSTSVCSTSRVRAGLLTLDVHRSQPDSLDEVKGLNQLLINLLTPKKKRSLFACGCLLVQ